MPRQDSCGSSVSMTNSNRTRADIREIAILYTTNYWGKDRGSRWQGQTSNSAPVGGAQQSHQKRAGRKERIRTISDHLRVWTIGQQSRDEPGETGSVVVDRKAVGIRLRFQLRKSQIKGQLLCPEAGHGVCFFSHMELYRGQCRLSLQISSLMPSRRHHPGKA